MSWNQLWCELLILIFVLAVPHRLVAQTGPQNDLNNQFQVRVQNLSLEDLSGSKLVLGVGLAATAKRDLTVDQVVFSGLRVNGIPIQAKPLQHRFKLRKDASVDLPEPLMITVDLHDLGSLTPLRKAVAEGHANLEGVASVRVPLSVMATIMRFSRHTEFSTQLRQQVPIDVPGGPLGSLALIKILDLAQSSWDLLQREIQRAGAPDQIP